MKNKAYLAVLLLPIFAALAAKPIDAVLEPTEPGKPSKILAVINPVIAPLEVLPARKHPVSSPYTGFRGSRSVDVILAYDNGSAASSLGGLAQDYHLGVWFQSPSACTLLAIYYYFYTGGAVTYYVSDPSDTINFLYDYEEYHGGVNPGPSPIETYLHPEVSTIAPNGWDTLNISGLPDVAKNVFFAAYIMNDGVSSPYIDPSIAPPYHTLMQRPGAGGGPFGWYSSWHHVYIRALVRMYENPPPMVETYDELPNSYLTTGRKVTATFSDFGIPIDSSGVVEGWTHYRIDGGSWDSLSMLLISGDSTYGVWEATLPGINPGQTMEYFFSCLDMQGLRVYEPPSGLPISYTIKEKTDDILFVNDDYYGGSYSYDVIGDVIPTADRWHIPDDGVPDSSVLLAGYDVIIWNTWELSGRSFAAETTLVAQFLNNGGNILISGMDIPAGEFGYSWGSYITSPGEFIYDYFEIVGGTDDFGNPDTCSIYFGEPGDPITGVFENWPLIVLPYNFVGPGYNYAGRFDDNIFNPIYWNGILADSAGNFSAFRFEEPGIYKAVWLYFPFAYIYDFANPYDPEIAQQREFISRILMWLGEQPSPLFENLTSLQTTTLPGPYPVAVTVIQHGDPLLSLDLIVSANGIEDTIPMVGTKADTTIYVADIPAYAQTTDIVYHVEAMCSDSSICFSNSIRFLLLVPASVLYVNESYDPVLDYRDIFDSLNIVGGYEIYEPALHGVPDSTVLPAFPAVIWNGDWGYGTILTKQSSTNYLYNYLNAGGNFLFGSDEILGLWDGWVDVDYFPGDFPYDALGVTHIHNDIMYDWVYGVAGDTISRGISTQLIFPLMNCNDEVDMLPSAIEIFTDASGSTIRGVRWEDVDNKVVFLPFMYVAMAKYLQVRVMERVLTWFGIACSVADGEGDELPKCYALAQNIPNPCHGKTRIHYSIPEKSFVSLRIYNAAGQLVSVLANGVEEAGYKTTLWNGHDLRHNPVAQGVYFYRIKAGDFCSTKKLLMVH
jgi:hypothetical protein